MRFETATAYVLGVALPVLEVCRRRNNFDDIPGYVDDFIVGALLFWAAHAVTKKKRYGPSLLVAAWGILCGGMWASFFGQLENAGQADISGLPNTIVLVIKLAFYGIAIVSLTLSIRRVEACATRGNEITSARKFLLRRCLVFRLLRAQSR